MRPGEVKRAPRVAAMLGKEIAQLIAREVKDPRVAFVTVTRVSMPDDLRSAQVLVRLVKDGDREERRKEALTGLRSAGGFLRKEASRRIGLRFAPELAFAYDEGLDDVTRIEELLEEVKAEERSRSRS
jgi:ribosome-binding factor A